MIFVDGYVRISCFMEEVWVGVGLVGSGEEVGNGLIS